MKKNVMMRVASVLLIMVLLTSSVISGTFAKYTTKGTSTDSARVAHFGVVVTGEGTMFAKEYDTGVAAKTVVSDTDTDGKDGNDKVVSPGTSGNLTHFVITGSPEVDVKVTYTATLGLANWTVEGNDYCPIIITVNGTDYQDTTMAGLKAKVEAAITGYSNTYDAGVELGDQTSNDLVVSWRWEYETDTVAHQTDDKDTALGNQAAAGAAATIALTVECIVTQVD